MRDMPSVFAAFQAAAAARPGHPFMIVPSRPGRAWLAKGTTLTYGAVATTVEILSAHYAAAGVGHGARVALLLENRPDFMFHFLALNALGAGIVPINPDHRHDELLYQMDHSDAALAIVLPERVADLVAVARDLGRPLPVADVDGFPDHLPMRATPVTHTQGPSRETECALLYTSGTTGRPKGCILSNGYFLIAGQGYLDHGGLAEIRPGLERFYNPLPLFHMNHLAVTATCAILSGNALILTERFSPSRWWREIAETRATIIHYLGIVAPTLLNQPIVPEERTHAVRFGLGAGVEPLLHKTFEERFGFPLIEVWGMTETGRLFVNQTEPRLTETRAFGRPTKDLTARVADDQDRTVAPGTPGELLVRHSAAEPRHGFFSGYLKNEAATAEAWRGDWFHTGDIVTQDESGMLYFCDRKKNMIRRSGENIAAAEVEAVLQGHAAVAQVAVIPVNDDIREQEVFACVVPMPGVLANTELATALFEHCNTRLAYFKTPGWLLFLDALPTTGTQKVQKTQIFPAGFDPRQHPGAIDLRTRKKRS
jgi:acyl-CoA synthetase (AMP-forming)/AMP-acid ligase II